MTNNLQSFILRTLMPHVNDKTNKKFWLPGLLQNLKDSDGKPVFPLKKTDSSTIALPGSNGQFIATTLAGDWAVFESNNLYDNETAIPDPSSAAPVITFSDLTIKGLPNVYWQKDITCTPKEDKSGYLTDMTLQFCYYPEIGNELTVTGTYDLKQKVCTADDDKPTVCDGHLHDSIEGKGNFKAHITDCCLNITFDLSVKDKNKRSLAFEIIDLSIKSSTKESLPTITYSDLTLENSIFSKKVQESILKMATMALSDEKGQKAIIGSIQNILMKPETLNNFSSFIGRHISNVLDDLFGSTSASNLPTDETNQKAATVVDLYLFDRMRAATKLESSGWYLPHMLASSGNPVLDTYEEDHIDIPDRTIEGLPFTNINLTNMAIKGVCNAIAPEDDFLLLSPIISAQIQIGTLQEGPERTFNRGGKSVTMHLPTAPPLTLSGDFTFTQGGITPETYKGHANIAIHNSCVSLKLHPSGEDVHSLVFTVESLALDLAKSTISANIELDPHNQTFSKIAERLIESSSVKDDIGTAINKQLKGQLGQISKEFTDTARKLINQQFSD